MSNPITTNATMVCEVAPLVYGYDAVRRIDEDPTGLLNEGFRYRDLETGVFITKDPLGFVDGPNVYTYVKQNPWTSFDPKGLETKIEEERKTDPKTGRTTIARHFTLTGKVLDKSSAKRSKEEQQKMVDKMNENIEKTYKGEYHDNKNNIDYVWDMKSKLTLAKDEKDAQSNTKDNVFRIVDKIPDQANPLVAGYAEIGGLNAYIRNDCVGDQKTVAHEYGHQLGLRHANPRDPNNTPGGFYDQANHRFFDRTEWDKDNKYSISRDNLMRYTSETSANWFKHHEDQEVGTRVDPGQVFNINPQEINQIK